MKKHFIFMLACTMVSLIADAQIVTHADGKISINSNATPKSEISVNSEGDSEYYFYTNAAKSPFFCNMTGNGNNWGQAGTFFNYSTTNNFIVGIKADAHSPNYVEQNKGRAYGVFGQAGYATSGWNFGIFGRLQGTRNGAAVYGTNSIWENGTYMDKRYAGYFNGETKVNGNFTVTGSVTGLILGDAAQNVAVTQSATVENTESASNKLSGLNAIGFYKSPISTQSIIEHGDTAVEVQQLSQIEQQNYSKIHYGLSAEQVSEAYPDLVYDNEDGTKSINYMELIPILVQSINELRNEIIALKQKNIANTNNSATPNYYNLSVDGNIVGIKKTR